MSLITIKSPKHCGAKQGHKLISSSVVGGRVYKKLLLLLSTLFTILLSIVLVAWLILRPSNPHFSLRQADVYQLNLSSAPLLLNSSVQITLFSSNPNSRLGVFYDALSLYASYKGQQITLESSIPPFFQDRQEGNVLTASLVGAGLPVASSFGYEVQRDQTAGKLVLSVKASGRLRWKVGTWVSGRHRFFVTCVAVLPFGPAVPSGPLSLRQGAQCSTQI